MDAWKRITPVALLLLITGAGCASKPGGAEAAHAIVLPFIENDFTQAVAKARQANLPLFVEVWAPW